MSKQCVELSRCSKLCSICY